MTTKEFAERVTLKILGDAKVKVEELEAPMQERYYSGRTYYIKLYYKRTRLFTTMNYFHSLIGEPLNPEWIDDIANVLCCLSKDSYAGSQSFEDFCSDYGYNTDSRNAEKTHNQCKKIFKQMQRVFGNDFQEFLGLEEQ